MSDSAVQAWTDGIPAHLAFWVAVIRDYPDFGVWHKELLAHLDPEKPVDPQLALLLPNRPRLRLLDVGSGPAARIGWRLPGKAVEVVAVDSLALLYNNLLAEKGLQSPVMTVQCDPEKLDLMLYDSQFDGVSFNNALALCYDPVAALTAALSVLAPDGVILVHGAADDGENAKYYATHQWNIRLPSPDVMEFWRPDAVRPLNLATLGARLEGSVTDGYLRAVIRPV